MNQIETHFQKIRNGIIGLGQCFESPQGKRKIIYADWTASGKLYKPIEEKLLAEIAPFFANTHSESTYTANLISNSYSESRAIIKKHVNSSDKDILITSGNGMTDVVNKFQRILGLKVPEGLKQYINIPEELKPIIFVTHMEHHSNHTSWLETIGDVIVVPPDENGMVSVENFKYYLSKYKLRKRKFAAITACSNVTGIQTPYYEIAKLLHQENGYCFVDFACSAPYVNIDMHPNDPQAGLDAIFFSPHKFLGGPGTNGVLLFNKDLYENIIPDNSGGGTVSWTNPWGGREYIYEIEEKEDGGTPGILQNIKIAYALKLKEEMGVKEIMEREKDQVNILFKMLESIPNLKILAANQKERLPIISFTISGLHYNLGVKLLNDFFGIQSRGGCSCAGTYGHYLLGIDQTKSQELSENLKNENSFEKPGWIRISVHPTTSNSEIHFICNSIKALAENYKWWAKNYQYNRKKNEFFSIND